jgi:hypothetical protein
LIRHRIHSGGFQVCALRFVSVFGSAKAGIHRGKLGGGLKANTVQRVAGTLRVPSADSQKALLFEGYGTWNVPTTLLR